MSSPEPVPAPHALAEAQPTPLSTALGERQQQGLCATFELRAHCGALTPWLFDGLTSELDSLLRSAAISDLGWRGKIRILGADRLRWLNGMVSNTVQSLPQNQGNYNFLLNAQGRIQGDGTLYRRSDDLLLDTGRDQISTLLGHLDHFIIMDDVELQDVSDQWTGLSLAGPEGPQVLAALGVALPPPPAPGENARWSTSGIGGVECIVIEAYHVLVPRYELWFPPHKSLAVWESLIGAGAVPAGLATAQSLRVLEATPLFGVDIGNRDLPQETNQTRALNFSKGCYLGQEIVERIRSRAKVHRQFRQFQLNGTIPPLPFDLHSAGQAVGRITSAASLSTPGFSGNFALGVVRLETVERQTVIEYEGGTATPREAPPHLPEHLD